MCTPHTIIQGRSLPLPKFWISACIDSTGPHVMSHFLAFVKSWKKMSTHLCQVLRSYWVVHPVSCWSSPASHVGWDVPSSHLSRWHFLPLSHSSSILQPGFYTAKDKRTFQWLKTMQEKQDCWQVVVTLLPREIDLLSAEINLSINNFLYTRKNLCRRNDPFTANYATKISGC